MKLYKRTWAEIDLDCLEHNYRAYRAAIPESTEIMCVVKASCYGHSDRAAAPFLQNELGVKSFAVSNLDEAVRLRDLGISGEILILGYTAPEEAEELIRCDILQTIPDLSYAAALSEIMQGSEGRVRCHAAVDTGMGRIGLRGDAAEIAAGLCKISAMGGIALEGAFTHYAAADTLSEDCVRFTERQSQLLYSAAALAAQSGVELKKLHSLNSAGGIFHYTENSAYARLGIILYGLTPDRGLSLPLTIKPVMSLKSVVSQVKYIEAGETVSYGRTFTADRRMKIATVACGYADGYPRMLSNTGEILVHGVRCPIVGRVCMDQFMCDVSAVEQVAAGDTVTLIGSEGGEQITADDIAAQTGTIGYEIVCGISERVPRVAIRHAERVGIYNL